MKQEKIEFIGEQLFIGQFGNIAIALAFASAFFAFLSYAISVNNTGKGLTTWKSLGRIGFGIHAISVFTIIGLIFYMLINHRFEYHYAWQHTSKSLPMKYVFAAFWEGQEGSFLLWTFWLVVLAMILMFTSKAWESRVMTLFALVQVFLISMVLGSVIDIPGIIDLKIGSNPFILTREHPNFMNAPFIKIPTYLQNLDGRGLNPALQNYWMTIHPPTLFLGFALTTIPFLFAVAGLWSGKLNEWMKPALPWTFVGIAVLGGGILMGGAWAYEALNFGGFWAWDPVENSSLVPWLTLVGAGHLMLVPKNKGTNLSAGIFLACISFILILYSTFLTRSGVLGDASVHAFTDLGMSGQLLIYLLVFIAAPAILSFPKISQRLNVIIIIIGIIAAGYFINYLLYATVLLSVILLALPMWAIRNSEYKMPKKIPAEPTTENNQDKKPVKEDEENLFSREFWMFVGALILFASAVHLTFETSKPVINKIFATKFAPADIDEYNQFQQAFAIIITLLIAFGQYLNYRQKTAGDFFKKIIRPLIVSVILTLVAVIVFPSFKNPVYITLVLTSAYAVLANLDYIIQVVKGKWKLMGPSIAHIGFSMVILGAVVSAGHKKVISENNNGINLEMLNEEFKNNENIMLHKHDTVQMGEYYLHYASDTLKEGNAYYEINYFKKNSSGSLEKVFTLHPKLIVNDRMGNVAEPSTQHYWNKDIFTHLTYIDLERVKERANPELIKEREQKEAQHFPMEKGDTIFGARFYVIFTGFEALSDINQISEDEENLSVKLRGVFIVKDQKNMVDTLYPIYEVKDNMLFTETDQSDKFGIELKVEKIVNNKEIDVVMRETGNGKASEFIIMKAIIFPGINILWIGCFLMVIGSLWAVMKRIF